jgi:YegS/Rv2252/BmrU family lipid kinase
VAIIANPISGRGQGQARAEAVARALGEREVQAQVHLTSAGGDGARLAAELDPAVDAVVAVGGDGTIREVVDGLRNLRVAVTQLPTGTANMLAVELGLPRDPDGCAMMVSHGHTVPFDLGRTPAGRFFMVAGVGFDAAVARTLSELRTGPIRMASYVLPILHTVARFGHPRLRVTVEGGDRSQTFTDVCTVVIGNIRTYGGPFEVTSYARHDTGSLDVVLVQGELPRVRALATMAAGLCRVVPLLPGVSYVHATRIQVEAPEPVPYQMDGDYQGETPVTFELEPEPLRVLAPPGTR